MSFAMMLTNDHCGRLLVSTHAMERWAERGEGGDGLDARARRATPFGGQFNGGMLLLDDDVVFVIKQKSDYSVMTTVLTKDQAIANMECFLGNSRTPHEVLGDGTAPARDDSWMQPPPSKSKQKRDAKKYSQFEGFLMRLIEVMNLDDVKFEIELAESVGVKRKLLEREHKHRRQLKKQRDHAELMAAECKALKAAMREVLTSDTVIDADWARIAREEDVG